MLYSSVATREATRVAAQKNTERWVRKSISESNTKTHKLLQDTDFTTCRKKAPVGMTIPFRWQKLDLNLSVLALTQPHLRVPHISLVFCEMWENQTAPRRNLQGLFIKAGASRIGGACYFFPYRGLSLVQQPNVR
jgi:hypothetical protein